MNKENRRYMQKGGDNTYLKKNTRVEISKYIVVEALDSVS